VRAVCWAFVVRVEINYFLSGSASPPQVSGFLKLAQKSFYDLRMSVCLAYFGSINEVRGLTYLKVGIPVIIVFTKYDEIVVAKEMGLWEKTPKIGYEELERQSRAEADENFETLCVEPLNRLRSRLGCGPMPYVKVSGEQLLLLILGL
jgi:hypothetical protein